MTAFSKCFIMDIHQTKLKTLGALSQIRDKYKLQLLPPNQQPGISLLNPALLAEMRWSVKLDSSNVPFTLNSAVSH